MKTTSLLFLFLLIPLVMKAEDRIAAKFRGSWEVIATLTKEGMRKPPSEKHYLELTATEFKRFKGEGGRSTMPAAPIFISESGRLWLVEPDGGQEVELGRVELRGEELHFIGAHGDHHLIYSRVKDNQKVEQSSGPNG